MREPSPPFEHVSWREEVEHHADEDVTMLAVTVMGRDEESGSSPVGPWYLAKIARYPLWAICIRALVGGAVVPVPVFLYAGTRLHYFTGAAHSHVDQNAVLSGVTLAFVGGLVGMAVGALWGVLVVGHARRVVRKATEHVGDNFGGGR